jgi:hypothetical protein
MEKQLLQVRAFRSQFERLPTSPQMSSQTEKDCNINELTNNVSALIRAKNISKTSEALMDILYTTLVAVHENGIADRAILLFDEVQKCKLANLNIGKPLKPNFKTILARDFSIYAHNEIAIEIAAIESERIENMIKNNIVKHLSLIDRIKFWLQDKIEASLKKKVKVNFPKTVDGNYSVEVYNKKHVFK